MVQVADFIIQRFVPNVPNETVGGWVDEGVVTDLKASEASVAVDQIAAANPEHTTATRRAVRWDQAEEFDTTPGPPRTVKGTKRSRDKAE